MRKRAQQREYLISVFWPHIKIFSQSFDDNHSGFWLDDFLSTFPEELESDISATIQPENLTLITTTSNPDIVVMNMSTYEV